MAGTTPAAAALAAGLALALMFPLRCVHPPGGAVAITAALGQTAFMTWDSASRWYRWQSTRPC